MKKRKKFHKIIIHPNRYLMWACAISLIVAAALVAYIYVGNIQSDIELFSSSNVNFWHTYRDANMSLRYPAEWLVDPGDGYVGFGRKTEDLFLVFAYSPPNDPAYESYSKLAGTKQIEVDGLPGISIQDRSSGQKIAFVKTSKVLYEFRGTTGYFDQILNTVKFIKK